MPKTYVPHSDTLVKKWLGHVAKTTTEKGNWKKIEVDGGSSYIEN